MDPGWGRQHRKRNVDTPEGKQAPAGHPDVHFESAREPRHTRRHEYGHDGHQPDVVEQMNARVLPHRARNQLRTFDIRPHGWSLRRYCRELCAATPELFLALTGLLPKLLLSRNGCEGTFCPPGG